jgi:GntR family transcriptional regulator
VSIPIQFRLATIPSDGDSPNEDRHDPRYRRGGEEVQRVHLANEPLSEYLRCEMAWWYAPKAEAGDREGHSMPGGTPANSKHRQIAGELHAAILAGDFPPGSRLPGENELMKERGVSRWSAQQTIATLVSWGVAETRRGSGVYVRGIRPVIRVESRRLGGDTWQFDRPVWAEAEGRNLGVDQIEVGAAIPPTHVRDILGLPMDAMAVRKSRRFLIDGKPVLLSRSWLPAGLGAGTPTAEPDQGYEPVRFREDLRARMPLPEESERLELTAGTPAVEIVRTAYDQDGTPIEVNEMIADAGAYVFRYEA